MEKVKVTVTAKIKLFPSIEQVEQILQTMNAYRQACNYVSQIVHETKTLSMIDLHHLHYRQLRTTFNLLSQMAQSVLKTVVARYKSLVNNGHPWTRIHFKKSEYDLVWRRDYSLSKQMFSINTLEGRIKVPYESKGMEAYFDGSWNFGTAKLITRRGRWYLHIPVTREVEVTAPQSIQQVVGIDLGINFVATTYDTTGKTVFHHGRPIKDKRSQYKHLRKSLQRAQTPFCSQEAEADRRTRKPLDDRCEPSGIKGTR